jgi:hypothetical protein
MLEMFLTVLTAIAVSSGGNFPIAWLRRYFVEEARRVPEIGALEPFWGSVGTAASAEFLYILEHPGLPISQVVAVTALLAAPTIVVGLPTYYAARGEWRGLTKASLPIVVALPALVLLQITLYNSGLSAAVVSAAAGVIFTIALVSGWGFAIRKGLLRSTTRDLQAERVSSLEVTLEEERVLIAQLTNSIEAARRSRQQQLAELRDAQDRIAAQESTIDILEQRNAEGNRALEQARLELAQLTDTLSTAHTIRDEQLLAARELRERVQELEAENAQLRAQLAEGDSDGSEF